MGFCDDDFAKCLGPETITISGASGPCAFFDGDRLVLQRPGGAPQVAEYCSAIVALADFPNVKAKDACVITKRKLDGSEIATANFTIWDVQDVDGAQRELVLRRSAG